MTAQQGGSSSEVTRRGGLQVMETGHNSGTIYWMQQEKYVVRRVEEEVLRTGRRGGGIRKCRMQ